MQQQKDVDPAAAIVQTRRNNTIGWLRHRACEGLYAPATVDAECRKIARGERDEEIRTGDYRYPPMDGDEKCVEAFVEAENARRRKLRREMQRDARRIPNVRWIPDRPLGALNTSTASPAVVRRTPSSGRPGRTPSRVSGTSRGLPRESDDPELRLCEGCGEPLPPGRPNKRHHNATCRKRAERSRADAELEAEAISSGRAAAAIGLLRRDDDQIDRLELLAAVVWPRDAIWGSS
jgi:hypothetical protein